MHLSMQLTDASVLAVFIDRFIGSDRCIYFTACFERCYTNKIIIIIIINIHRI